ncbi:MAG: hypothetical protein Q4E09_02010 [Eubacteriales bacterium]|nr:hypothetical protein [Eubacteriales bacterium]
MKVYLEARMKEALTLNQGANFSPKMLLNKQGFAGAVNLIQEWPSGAGSLEFLKDNQFTITLIKVVDEAGNNLEALDTNVPGVYEVTVLIVLERNATIRTTGTSIVTVLGSKNTDQAAPAQQAAEQPADSLYAPAPPPKEDEEVEAAPLYAPTAPAKTAEAEPEQKPMDAKPTTELVATSVASPLAVSLAPAFLLLILRKVR